MDDIDKFIKCPGLLKKNVIKKIPNVYRVDKRFWAFFVENNVIVLIKWLDDMTVSMIQKERSILLELWRSGKRVKGKKWNREMESGLFVACMNFYEIEDYLKLESTKDKDLLDFLF